MPGSDTKQTLFVTTRWTVVYEAARGGDTEAVKALDALFATYWQPLYRYARRKGKSREDAEDLVQGFFAHLLETEALRAVDRGRGRFRALLLASFNHWMINDVMEFVDGVNLRDLLRDGKIEPKQALAIVPPICDALQYAHEKGIVHRDIKPENLLLDREGRVKIADFGIAKIVAAVCDRRNLGGGEESQRRSQTATMHAGTPQYMSPEQIEAPGEVDHRADIYALGVVLYEMLTGERPGKDVLPPSSRMHGTQIDVRLDEIVLRALEKQPELRYQQASIFKTQVETIATSGIRRQGAGISQEEISPRFSRTAIAGAVCAGVGIFGLLAMFMS